jgi:chromosomal replication initiation ATPase DnaA
MSHTGQPRRRMADIAVSVATERGVSLDDLRNASRVKPITNARQEAMLLMVEAGFTTTQVGRFLRRDHSTVVHGAQVARQRRLENRMSE